MKLTLDEEWTLGGPLGDGGFGTVYEAENAAGVKAAVKLVPKKPGTEREMLFTNLDGIRNVVPVIDSGEHKDNWVLVMPRAEESLREHLDQHGPLPLGKAVAVLTDIVESLADLSERGIVHRDLKPQNILLLNGHWCLADFGMARYADASTATNTFKGGGSLPYMAPETWRNQRATSATDVYALGILAYELLEGTRPFNGPQVHDYQGQHLQGTAPPLTAAPLSLGALVTECLYKAPQARPGAGNILERLHRVPVALTGGLAALSSAYQDEVARRSETERQASAAASEAERRRELLDAAVLSIGFIAEQVQTAIMNVISSAEVRRGDLGGWTIRLSDAQLIYTGPRATNLNEWNEDGKAPFDVIAHSAIMIKIPQDRSGYDGRSHSLWYADAQEPGRYQWFETAFMDRMTRAVRSRTTPCALNPHHEARGALGFGTPAYQPAWPFTPLVIDDLDEFIDRWATWFAQAAQGKLGYPSNLPERSPYGSWRK